MKAKQDRAQLYKVIKEQSEAIDGLSKELQKATDTIDALRSAVAHAMEHVDELPTWTGFVSAQIARANSDNEECFH
jgi:cell division septum initiation protein DivIVA